MNKVQMKKYQINEDNRLYAIGSYTEEQWKEFQDTVDNISKLVYKGFKLDKDIIIFPEQYDYESSDIVNRYITDILADKQITSYNANKINQCFYVFVIRSNKSDTMKVKSDINPYYVNEPIDVYSCFKVSYMMKSKNHNDLFYGENRELYHSKEDKYIEITNEYAIGEMIIYGNLTKEELDNITNILRDLSIYNKSKNKYTYIDDYTVFFLDEDNKEEVLKEILNNIETDCNNIGYEEYCSQQLIVISKDKYTWGKGDTIDRFINDMSNSYDSFESFVLEELFNEKIKL